MYANFHRIDRICSESTLLLLEILSPLDPSRHLLLAGVKSRISLSDVESSYETSHFSYDQQQRSHCLDVVLFVLPQKSRFVARMMNIFNREIRIAYRRGIIQSRCFNYHVDDGRETAPRRDVKWRLSALWTSRQTSF